MGGRDRDREGGKEEGKEGEREGERSAKQPFRTDLQWKEKRRTMFSQEQNEEFKKGMRKQSFK